MHPPLHFLCARADDLAQSGGTLIECARELRKLGALAVSAYVTHVVFPGEAETKFVGQHGGSPVLEHFWCTSNHRQHYARPVEVDAWLSLR